MNCAELGNLLSGHCLAELTPDQRAAVAAHTAECEACRERWGSDSLSLQLHVATEPAPRQPCVHDGVMARLHEDAASRTPEQQVRPGAKAGIAGYVILGVLGRGGMGIAYKARQVSVDRIVALKVMPEAVAQDRSFVERFVREARAAAAVSHPNVVQVHDVGQDGNTHYIVMEFVEGENLAEAIRRDGPLALSAALAIMKQVASAIAAAHERGVLHRDLKPSNILMTRGGQVKVADFGLAKRLGRDTTVTEPGHTLGTPLYSSPEIAHGQPRDQRSDLYSLGATFYHVLAGRPPFEGTDAVAVALKHINEEAPRLDDRVPGIPSALSRIVHRLLEKDPGERFQSAGELLAALELVDTGTLQATATRAYPVVGDASAPATRRKALRRIAAVVGGVVLVVAAFRILVPGRSAAPPRPSADEWVDLFDGLTLRGWRVVREFPDGQVGADACVQAGCLIVEKGDHWSGVAWTGDFPSVVYEVKLDAMRLDGHDCFCMMTFPVGDSHLVLNVGGWGGSILGVELVDGDYGNRNLTTHAMSFENKQWYSVGVRVTEEKVEVRIDGKKVVDLPTAGHVLLPSGYGAPLKPFGLGSAVTRAAFRNIRLRRLSPTTAPH